MNFHVKRVARDVILNRVERGEGSLVGLCEILLSLKLPQDDLIHQNTIHIINLCSFATLSRAAEVGLKLT